MHVDRHDTTFCTPYSFDQCSTLSFIATFSRQNSTLYFMLEKSPPTRAARWMTCVGRCFSNISRVASFSRRSPSFDVRNTQCSPETCSRSTAAWIPLPTRPEPPVTSTTTSSAFRFEPDADILLLLSPVPQRRGGRPASSATRRCERGWLESPQGVVPVLYYIDPRTPSIELLDHLIARVLPAVLYRATLSTPIARSQSREPYS
jgi:hypothetical protein